MRFFEARNLRIPLYPDGSTSLTGVVRINRVFTENRRLGFFRVKLLPVSVVAGMRLDLSETTPNTNWLSGFRLPRGLVANRGGVEWRDASVSLPGDLVPRFQVKRLRLPAAVASEYLLLEDVTLQTDSGPVNVPQARLLLRGAPGSVVWQIGAQINHWDLFTGKLHRSQKQNPENP